MLTNCMNINYKCFFCWMSRINYQKYENITAKWICLHVRTWSYHRRIREHWKLSQTKRTELEMLPDSHCFISGMALCRNSKQWIFLFFTWENLSYSTIQVRFQKKCIRRIHYFQWLRINKSSKTINISDSFPSILCNVHCCHDVFSCVSIERTVGNECIRIGLFDSS